MNNNQQEAAFKWFQTFGLRSTQANYKNFTAGVFSTKQNQWIYATEPFFQNVPQDLTEALAISELMKIDSGEIKPEDYLAK